MFSKDIYIQRRNTLKQKMGSGLIIIPGNNNAPFNYPANTYKFRQDSTFLYFFGHQIESLVGIIDVDNDKEYLLGDDVDIDDIIWYGSIDSISDLAAVNPEMPAPMIAIFAISFLVFLPSIFL